MPIPHLKQGTLDGLCGVYALLNAIFQRIYHDRSVSYKHQDDHFRTAMSCLPKMSVLSAVTNGLTCDELMRLTRKFVKHYSFDAGRHRYEIRVDRPYEPNQITNRWQFHDAMRNLYQTERTAAILGMSYRGRSSYRRDQLSKSGHWLALRACKPNGFYVVNNSPNDNYISKNNLLRPAGIYMDFDYHETIVLRAVKVS